MSKKNNTKEKQLLSKIGVLLSGLYQFIGSKWDATDTADLNLDDIAYMDIITATLDELDDYYDEDMWETYIKEIEEALERSKKENHKLLSKK